MKIINENDPLFQSEEEKRANLSSSKSLLDSSDIFGKGNSPTKQELRRLAELKVGQTVLYMHIDICFI